MRFNAKILILGVVVGVFCCVYFVARCRCAMNFTEFKKLIENDFDSFDSVKKVFPRKADEVKVCSKYAIDLLKSDIDSIINIKPEERNFQNTAQAFDGANRKFSIVSHILSFLEMVSPEKDVRETCHESSIELTNFYVENVACNKKVYQAFNDYACGNFEKEKLNSEQKLFVKEVLKDFKRQGLHLSDEQLEKVKNFEKELAKLGLDFESNVAKDNSSILAEESKLQGLSKDFIDSLPRDNEKVVLGCDYPTYFEVMQHCTCEDIRKDLYRKFNNRAWPVNIDCLTGIIRFRDKLARRVGFKNYAELDLDSGMVKKLETAEEFLNNLAIKSNKKAALEIENFLKELPDNINLDSGGKLQPWNFSYIKSCYKKKHFSIDEREIAQYFPVDKTLHAIFEIYQNFLGLKFEICKPEWAWHDDVLLIKILDPQLNILRGYLFVDLYPRENKYSHACCMPMIPTQLKGNGKVAPAVLAIIANFPKSQKDRPALLKFDDVNTFFHEFGHAMHDVLGATQMASFAGTSVKTDFVEVPSQMFEEWMSDKSVLKKLSSHYQSGQPLPDELIDKLIYMKKFDSGSFILRQCCLSFISLEFFKDGKIKDADLIIKNLFTKYQSHLQFDEQTHFHTSFGHLVGYGAKYYSYMWSKVFALDLFYDVKKRGLFDPAVGKELVSKVLSKGGSVDPEELLKDFLGRKPTQDAFLSDMGIE